MHLLITGHAGFLGYWVQQMLPQTYRFTGLSRSASHGNIALDLSGCDVTALSNYAFDGIIHLAAQADVNRCEAEPEHSRAVNVLASEHLAAIAAARNIPFVFASSDQVYDGQGSFYTEADKAKPLNQYGKQKAAAERRILAVHPEAVCCRLSLLIGHHPEEKGYQRRFLTAVKKQEPITLFTDEYRSPIRVEDAARTMLKALHWPGGIYNVGGPERLDRYTLGCRLAQEAGEATTHLKGGLQSDVNLRAPRPADISMDCSKALALGMQTKPIAGGLDFNREN